LLCTLDVGQGDATVLRTRRGHWLAIDAGPRFGATDAGVRVVLPFLLSNGARSLELFVLTHPDLDHLGGAAAVLERLQVRRVLDAALPVPAARYEEYLTDVAAEGSRWLVGRPGARLKIDEIEVLVLGPALSPSGSSAEAKEGRRPINANEASLSLRIEVDGGFSYVNAGDAPAAEERRMLMSWPPDTLRADVFKVQGEPSRQQDVVGRRLARGFGSTARDHLGRRRQSVRASPSGGARATRLGRDRRRVADGSGRHGVRECGLGGPVARGGDLMEEGPRLRSYRKLKRRCILRGRPKIDFERGRVMWSRP
jgi:hypothetical protein